MVAMAIPAYVALVPLVVVLRTMGLLDTHLGVILPTAAFNVPVTLFIMRAFFVTLPRELMDAARIDGCSEFGIFWRIAVPLARPAMFTAAIVNMIWVWNDFLFPLVFINTPAKKTLPVGLADFVGEHITNYPVMLAAIFIAALAPLTQRAVKAAINAAVAAPGEADWDRARRLAELCFASDDYAEGRAAFRQKRELVFGGS